MRQKEETCCFWGGIVQDKERINTAPRKAIVQALGDRRLAFVLDEFRTSKMCPGGCGGEMKDTSSYRVRRCTTEFGEGRSSMCPLSRCGDGPFTCDRDASATINMTLSIKACLDGQSWPSHLLRPKKWKFPFGGHVELIPMAINSQSSGLLFEQTIL